MGLAPEVLSGLSDMGFTAPSPIQAKAIPLGVTGRDLIASASTGTGKTAAFLIPILQQLVGAERGVLRVVVLTPTRELALQLDEQALALGYHVGFSSVAIVGGMKMSPQEDAIRSGVEIIVATPGRLMDHMRQKYLDMSTVQFLVIDEADRMFDMGFLPDVHRIVSNIHSGRTQKERIAALEDFRKGTCPILVATDVAARGIDVSRVSHVVHFDVPRSPEDYIHRSGRTGRAGESGEVITFVAPDEERDFATIERAIGGTIQRDTLPDFDPGLGGGRGRSTRQPRRPRRSRR